MHACGIFALACYVQVRNNFIGALHKPNELIGTFLLCIGRPSVGTSDQIHAFNDSHCRPTPTPTP